MIPSLILAILFIFCFAFFVNFLNKNIEFETPFMEKIAIHTERTASLTIAVFIVNFLSQNFVNFEIFYLPPLIMLLTYL